jgi:hypothetical protein
MTTFLLRERFDHYAIVNDDFDLIVGWVYPLNGKEGPYRVTADVSPFRTFEAGTVNSLSDAILAFLAYYKKYPPRWERHGPREYCKDTLNVTLRVVQDEQGGWKVYRDDYPLLRDGNPERFGARADAQQVADAHELDGYPNAKEIADGLLWEPDPEFDWRSIPHRVEERANWRRASGSLP